MKIDIVVPRTPEKAPKIRYKIPISLWFVEKNHLDTNKYNFLRPLSEKSTQMHPLDCQTTAQTEALACTPSKSYIAHHS